MPKASRSCTRATTSSTSPRSPRCGCHGSVVRSWLLELLADALASGQDLADLKGWVADSGEGRWTVQEAIDHDVPAPVITLSLLTRFRSRQDDSYGAKVLAALRNEFGGHAVKSDLASSQVLAEASDGDHEASSRRSAPRPRPTSRPCPARGPRMPRGR